MDDVLAQLVERPLSVLLRRAIEVVGAVGHLARALVLAVVGVLLVTAAVASDAERAGGLDALWALAETPVGPALLVAVAGGFGAFGAYCLADAAFWRARVGLTPLDTVSPARSRWSPELSRDG